MVLGVPAALGTLPMGDCTLVFGEVTHAAVVDRRCWTAATRGSTCWSRWPGWGWTSGAPRGAVHELKRIRPGTGRAIPAEGRPAAEG